MYMAGFYRADLSSLPRAFKTPEEHHQRGEMLEKYWYQKKGDFVIPDVNSPKAWRLGGC